MVSAFCPPTRGLPRPDGSTPTPEIPPMSTDTAAGPNQLGNYDVVEKIAEGGMGLVDRAHPALGDLLNHVVVAELVRPGSRVRGHGRNLGGRGRSVRAWESAGRWAERRYHAYSSVPAEWRIALHQHPRI